jgi:hypothetical protein
MGKTSTAVAVSVVAISVVSVAVSLLAVGTANAGQAKKKPMALTGVDYAEIQQLSTRYAQAIDSCADDGYAYADLYTPDGTFVDMWTQSSIDAGGVKWQGREKLRDISSGANVTGAPCTSSRFNGSVTHMILNLVIVPTPDAGTGTAAVGAGRTWICR